MQKVFHEDDVMKARLKLRVAQQKKAHKAQMSNLTKKITSVSEKKDLPPQDDVKFVGKNLDMVKNKVVPGVYGGALKWKGSGTVSNKNFYKATKSNPLGEEAINELGYGMASSTTNPAQRGTLVREKKKKMSEDMDITYDFETHYKNTMNDLKDHPNKNVGVALELAKQYKEQGRTDAAQNEINKAVAMSTMTHAYNEQTLNKNDSVMIGDLKKQIDLGELNKYTLAKYQNKAAPDLAVRAMDQGSGLKDRSTDANKQKIKKRMIGIGTAARKLSGGGYTGGVGPESPTGKMHNEDADLNNVVKSLDKAKKKVKDHIEVMKEDPTTAAQKKSEREYRSGIDKKALMGMKPTDTVAQTMAKYLKTKDDTITAMQQRQVVDEVSKKTLGSYVDKATDSLMKKSYRVGSRDMQGTYSPHGSVGKAKVAKDEREVVNRRAGIKGAARRLSKEEVDQVDELNVRTMRSYKDKAAGDLEDRVRAGHTTPTDKTKKRMQGIGRASDKIQTAKIMQRQKMGVNELKTSTLKSYLKKARDVHSDMLNPHTPDDYEPHKVDQERDSGRVYKGDEIARAKAKLAKRGVNELKTPTLKKYLSKADDSVTDMAQDGKSATSKFNKRRLGMAKAQGRLSMNRQLGRAESVKEEYFKDETILLEDGHTDVASAVRKQKQIIEDATQILMKLNTMQAEGNLPTWWMNKIAVSASMMNSARDYLLYDQPAEMAQSDAVDPTNT